MTDSKHTRGPWVAKRVKGLGSALAWFEFRSASTLPVPIFNKSTLAIDCAPVCLAPEDAALIEAAPDLLDALEDAVQRMKRQLILLRCDDEFISKEVKMAVVAIKKARGLNPD